jgi:hypothetical protein
VVKFGATEVEGLLPSYSEFEHTQPGSFGTRTAMNVDEINISFLFGNSHKTKKYTFKNIRLK